MDATIGGGAAQPATSRVGGCAVASKGSENPHVPESGSAIGGRLEADERMRDRPTQLTAEAGEQEEEGEAATHECDVLVEVPLLQRACLLVGLLLEGVHDESEGDQRHDEDECPDVAVHAEKY